ncbi:hypothetical protein [Streptomyces tsukubensis]|uniref:Uncharacterized protein n=1 Tax=Streptomyces tsukubensis TaxID=83656 RepID=A0A1V4AFL7_9ACTN|nr:hypothetical protein [Streptomyces tsukubensis]OON82692.1 hypothetical protein B1H18_01155 [Streptomyces tsukubensis]QFR92135.1 hypothetical protein GBW32_02530 [Streptomyces tsukubensis]
MNASRRHRSPASQTTDGSEPGPLDGQQITQTECRGCGTQIAGLNGRYACSMCGWANEWSEGHTSTPPRP